MDWGKWIDGKTKKKIDGKVEAFWEHLEHPEEMVRYEMMVEYAKRLRPDLWEEFVTLERESITISDSTNLSEDQKERKIKELFGRLVSVLNRITDDAEMRERGPS